MHTQVYSHWSRKMVAVEPASSSSGQGASAKQSATIAGVYADVVVNKKNSFLSFTFFFII